MTTGEAHPLIKGDPPPPWAVRWAAQPTVDTVCR